MTEVVVDASVAAKWCRDEAQSVEARRLLVLHQSGEQEIAVPPLLSLELVNAAGRRWRWEADLLRQLVENLARLRLRVVEPGLAPVAEWTARGLTAYDASYVSLAEELGCALVTADETILTAAPAVARTLDERA